MEFYGISVEEVAKPIRKRRLPPPVLPPLYAHPSTGCTWDGQGSQPQWLKDALVKEGYRPQELRDEAARRVQAAAEAQAAGSSGEVQHYHLDDLDVDPEDDVAPPVDRPS